MAALNFFFFFFFFFFSIAAILRLGETDIIEIVVIYPLKTVDGDVQDIISFLGRPISG